MTSRRNEVPSNVSSGVLDLRATLDSYNLSLHSGVKILSLLVYQSSFG